MGQRPSAIRLRQSSQPRSPIARSFSRLFWSTCSLPFREVMPLAAITLFDPSKVSSDQRSARADEDHYEYLSWSGRPEMAAIRSCLEEWFVEYPDDAKQMLSGRFRGSELTSSVFELYVYTLLRKQGYRPVVTEPSPQRAASKMPDFRIDEPGGRVIYVEATTVDCDPDASKRDRNLTPLHVALSGLSAPCRFSVGLAKEAKSPLAFSKFRRRIEAWFRSDAFPARRMQAIAAGEDSFDEEIPCGDWVIEVTAYVTGRFGEPPPPGESPIVLWGTGVHALDPVKEFRKGVKRKAEHYSVDGPLVLAVSPLGYAIDSDAIEAALYGPTWETLKHDGSSTIERRGHGLWFSPGRDAQNRSVPAVLVCHDVHPSTLACPTPVLYHAPQASCPVHEFLPRVSHARLEGLPVNHGVGASGCDLLGLPLGWPRVPEIG